MNSLRKILAGTAIALTLAAPLVTPQPAAADWHGGGWHGGGWHSGGWNGGWGWRSGWHGGWGWRGGVWVGGPAVVVGAPVTYGAPGYRWIPPHYAPYGRFVPGHWGY